MSGMTKKSFIEAELDREARIRSGFKLPSLFRRGDKGSKDRTKEIIAAKKADRYGLMLTPNEMRAKYGYPTISDTPQCTELVLENESLRTSSLIQQLYTIAIQAMHDYPKGETTK